MHTYTRTKEEVIILLLVKNYIKPINMHMCLLVLEKLPVCCERISKINYSLPLVPVVLYMGERYEMWIASQNKSSSFQLQQTLYCIIAIKMKSTIIDPSTVEYNDQVHSYCPLYIKFYSEVGPQKGVRHAILTKQIFVQ